ncbi:hypothetical protein [Kordiimonas sp. SCSIO 12610]|uniref:hypothetical protein n=1 Tax=Kordiimonas sp. SCSIO 12610 TaxID=2829597 RepID=UPI00210F0B6C|nr:hypothetical protein [Kordiimonas sp. SCSIO 12610]UTW56076.1 hypothetical protein KFF44_04055 [Kordiimonas sp. SCSIO 12610]
MKQFILVILTIILFTTNPLQAKDKWLELTSEHFILRTNAKAEKARKTIEDLEKFRFTLGALTGLDLSVDNRPPLTIYAFKKRRDFQKQLKTNKNVAGFYYQRPDRAISPLSFEDGKEIWQLKGLEVIFHEYSHHILHHYSPFKYPKWYDEGFGEYLSTITFDGKIATIAEPPVHRFLSLHDTKFWVRIEDIIRARAAYPEKGRTRRGRKIDAKDGLYAQGWLLTHYLFSKPEYKEPLNAYMRALNEPNISDDQAFQTAFGKSYKEMESELLAYWKKGSLSVLGYDFSKRMPDFKVTMREMPEAEAKIQYDEVRHLTGNRAKKFKEAQKSFEAALKAGIRPDDMRLYLAELALYNDQPDIAREYANAILQTKPDYAPALQMLSSAFAHGKNPLRFKDQELSEYRALVTNALRADKYYVPALLDYANLFLHSDADVRPNAIEVAALARKLAPDSFPATSTHINLLWKSGNLDQARREAQLLIDWTGNPDYKKQNRETYRPLLEASGNE